MKEITYLNDQQFERYLDLCRRMFDRMRREDSFPWSPTGNDNSDDEGGESKVPGICQNGTCRGLDSSPVRDAARTRDEHIVRLIDLARSDEGKRIIALREGGTGRTADNDSEPKLAA